MKRFRAFTMAEILISLTIIGVIAAITLPALQANINESAWRAQRKALYSRMSQAISMLPSLNGYGVVFNNNGQINETQTNEKATQTFIADGLSKVLQINNICTSNKLVDCNLPLKITTMPNASGARLKIDFPKSLHELNEAFDTSRIGLSNFFSILNTQTAAYETKNGVSIAVYYNPFCRTDNSETANAQQSEYTQPLMCANFIYDLNGKKGPNTVGKDIGFMTALYSVDPVIIAPQPLTKNSGTDDGYGNILATHYNAPTACKTLDKDSRLPNKDELASMFFNKRLINMTTGLSNYWSATIFSSNFIDGAWYQMFYNGSRLVAGRNSSTPVRCIKR